MSAVPKRYWLMKSEPSVFSIQDLQNAPNRTTSWEGVRNYQARNFLRDDMKVGDGVLFYHSNAEPPGVAGIAEIVRAGYPDPHAFDLDHKYYDPKSKPSAPTWYMVDIRFVSALSRVISLEELKATAGLEDMMVTRRGSRLSVQPVTPEEWKIVTKLAKKLQIAD